MKSLAELVLSFLFFWVLPDGFCGVPCDPPEYPPILLGLPPLIAAASCGAPEIAAARIPSRYDPRSRCDHAISNWRYSYNAAVKRVRLIAIVLKAPGSSSK